MHRLPQTFRFFTGGRYFHHLPLGRQVLTSQLPLTVTTFLVLLTAAATNAQRVLADPVFIGGLLLIALPTLASWLVPWQRFRPDAYWAIPLPDLLGIGGLAVGGYPDLVGLPMLTAIPVFWMVWSSKHPRFTLVVAFTATLAISVLQYRYNGQVFTIGLLGRPIIMPLIILALAATVSIAAASIVDADRRLAAALDEARAKAGMLDAVLNAANVGLVATDAQGNDLLMNRHQRRHHMLAAPEGNEDPDEAQLLIFGADSRARPLGEPLPAEQRPVYRAVRREEFSDELYWLGPPGSQEAVTVSARGLSDAEGGFAGTVVVFQNVTAMLHVMQAQERFLANVSHELRTPLTSILGFLEITADDPALPASAARSLRIAKDNAERLNRLVDDLLSAAAHKMEVRRRIMCLVDVVRGTVESLQPRADAAGVSISWEAPSAGLTLAADPVRLGQVMDNLLTNAVKYTGRGGKVDVRVAAVDGTASVTVADTGPGMDEEEVRRLFDRFYRTDGVRRAGIPGVGLGLPIARELVEAHGGTLGVTSTQGVGTTFEVRLPLTGPSSPARLN